MARSEYDLAIPLLERSYARLVELSGPDDAESARLEHQLALAIQAFHGSGAATPLLRTSSDRLARLLGTTHPDALGALKDLALATDDAAERSRLMDRVVSMHYESGTGDSVATAALLNAQATDYVQRGRLREALALFEESGAILDRTLAPEHPNRLTVAGNTVAVFMALALHDRGEALARSVLESRERVLGSESAEVAIAKENLALILANQGRIDEAETLLHESLFSSERLLAPGHDRIRNTLRNLGLVVALGGRPMEGLALLDSALVDGPAPGIGQAYLAVQRGLLLLRLGRADEAGDAITTAAVVLERQAPDGHIYRSHLAVAQGILSLVRGDPRESEARFDAAISLLEPAHAPDHPLVSQAACGIAVSRAHQVGTAPALRASGDRACIAYARWGLANVTLLEWAGLR